VVRGPGETGSPEDVGEWEDVVRGRIGYVYVLPGDIPIELYA
jgi:hypothetical protein